MTDRDADRDALQAELARTAREVAGELIKPDPDRDRVASLDARIETLRATIRERTPPRPDDGVRGLGRAWSPIRDR